jgi:hypothetical protein
MAKKIPSEVANAKVLDTDGGEHRLGDSWKKKPVVLLFVRHFG